MRCWKHNWRIKKTAKLYFFREVLAVNDGAVMSTIVVTAAALAIALSSAILSFSPFAWPVVILPGLVVSGVLFLPVSFGICMVMDTAERVLVKKDKICVDCHLVKLDASAYEKKIQSRLLGKRLKEEEAQDKARKVLEDKVRADSAADDVFEKRKTMWSRI